MKRGEELVVRSPKENEKGEPTPNRVQSSLLELPRCEGGKDRKAGLKEKEPCGTENSEELAVHAEQSLTL
jgi:hypothetical protein